jgi:hypothetical protein
LENSPSSSHLIKENPRGFPHATSSSSGAAEIMIYSKRDRLQYSTFPFLARLFRPKYPPKDRNRTSQGLCRIVRRGSRESGNPCVFLCKELC